jgi:hypothetical protein
MAGLNASARNLIVDAISASVTHIGLADASGTEITGGTPAYARKAITETAGAAGIADNNAALIFDVPASTVCFFLLTTAVSAGTTHAILPVQGATPQLPKPATFLQATDVFTCVAHGWANGTRIVLSDAATGGLAAGFDENTIYFVVTSATDSFQLSLTSGGAAITSAASMNCFATLCVPEVFAAQGTYTFATGALDYDANLI